jgi:hypothetical protein
MKGKVQVISTKLSLSIIIKKIYWHASCHNIRASIKNSSIGSKHFEVKQKPESSKLGFKIGIIFLAGTNIHSRIEMN